MNSILTCCFTAVFLASTAFSQEFYALYTPGNGPSDLLKIEVSNGPPTVTTIGAITTSSGNPQSCKSLALDSSGSLFTIGEFSLSGHDYLLEFTSPSTSGLVQNQGTFTFHSGGTVPVTGAEAICREDQDGHLRLWQSHSNNSGTYVFDPANVQNAVSGCFSCPGTGSPASAMADGVSGEGSYFAIYAGHNLIEFTATYSGYNCSNCIRAKDYPALIGSSNRIYKGINSLTLSSDHRLYAISNEIQNYTGDHPYLLEIDTVTGSLLQEYELVSLSKSSGEVTGLEYVGPIGSGLVLSTVHLHAGSPAILRADGATPSSSVGFALSLAGPGSTNLAAGVCGTIAVGLKRPVTIIGATASNSSGSAYIDSGVLPPGTAGTTVWFQAIDIATCRLSNVLVDTIQ